MRERYLKKIKQEIRAHSIPKVAKKIGVSYISLWRILNGTNTGGTKIWDKIFEYYK
jgi:molybdenum-dependent DNA-binding transcriptional regulator ModE